MPKNSLLPTRSIRPPPSFPPEIDRSGCRRLAHRKHSLPVVPASCRAFICSSLADFSFRASFFSPAFFPRRGIVEYLLFAPLACRRERKREKARERMRVRERERESESESASASTRHSLIVYHQPTAHLFLSNGARS